jgi:hypothetical protein
MTPNIIHFVYVGGRPFSFIHFLAVYSAWKVNRPDCLYFHHTEEPTGTWWEKARPLLTLNRVEPVHEVHGNPIKYPAHMADVIRLAMLRRFGGIYLDLDIVCLNPFAPLRENDFVMGVEPGAGLCNAVIIARHDARFLGLWQEQYRSFDNSRWNHHSVVLPWQLAQANPGLIHVADKYAFFYPTHNDPVHRYLWGERPAPRERLTRLAKNLCRMIAERFSGKHDAIRQAHYQTFHVLRGREWHFRRASQSYCLHLWEGLWGAPYLKAVTPAYLRNSPSNFARLLRDVLGPAELDAMELPGAMPGTAAFATVQPEILPALPGLANGSAPSPMPTFSMRYPQP